MIIFMYHSLTEEFVTTSHLVVTAKTFKKQIEYIQKHYKVVPITQFEIYKNHKDCAILTFDDGFLDNYTIAFPVLKKLNLPFSIFLATKYVGDKMILGKQEKTFLNWEQIQEMHQSNLVYFGAHTHTHIDCKKAQDDEITYDIQENLNTIKSHLGYTPKYFCYPKGRIDNQKYHLFDIFDYCFRGEGIYEPNIEKYSIPRIELFENTPLYKLSYNYYLLRKYYRKVKSFFQ